MDEAPDWLLEMRAISGLSEKAGIADEPKILAMRDYIARTFPDMASYCAQYQHDSTPWCGLAAAYCMARAGIRPPFGRLDTERFLWAKAWADDDIEYIPLTKPRLGCVVVLTRSGGGHVTFYESTSGTNYKCRGGNQSDAVNIQSFPIKDVVGLVWPKAEPLPVPAPVPVDRRVLSRGDSGADVAAVQKTLGIPIDGDYGSTTEAAVQGFQAATGLEADGVVGPDTYDKLDDLDERMEEGYSGLSPELTLKIIAVAKNADIVNYSWVDRGRAPLGYIAGMALTFALATIELAKGNSAAVAMARADTGDPDKDALTWYTNQFKVLSMDNSRPGVDTLRHLFVLLTGLGMRESSGQYCEGRDASASNVTADTAEAGLFQMSWNARTASPELQKLFDAYLDDPQGFLPVFQMGVDPSPTDLQNYGSGAGATYQWLAKYCPAFAVMTAAVGLRVLRKHWGPITRKEVDLTSLADNLFKAVQILIEREPKPEPVPEPVPEPRPENLVDIVTTGNVTIRVNGEIVV